MQSPISGPAPSSKSKSKRYQEIVAALARHGFHLVGETLWREDAQKQQHRAEHLRQVCEELGTTFIKLGQILSTRGDLLPEPFRVELTKLQDEVPPIGREAIESVIVEEFGAPSNELFVRFDAEPLGSASIAQVHAARLHGAREVVVKVQKPGVAETVDVDLEIIAELAETCSRRFPLLAEYDLPNLAREFSDTLRRELDYTREAANIEFFRETFADEPRFQLPSVIQNYSSGRILTLTRVRGTPLAEASHLPKRQRVALAKRLTKFVLEPVFESGIFHADPHSGNFLLARDGALAVMDFGMVGNLTREARRRVADLFIAVRQRDADRLTDAIVALAAPDHPIERARLSDDINRLLEGYVALPFESVRLADAIGELLEVVRQRGLRFPGSVALLFKTLVMCEGLLRTLDPEATLAEHIEPLARKLMYGQLGADDFAERARDSAVEVAQLTVELPRRIDRVLGQVESGSLRVWGQIEGLDRCAARFEHAVERANATMLASACIVGLAILMLLYQPPGWQRWIGVVFWVGVTIALAVSLRTAWRTVRERRERSSLF